MARRRKKSRSSKLDSVMTMTFELPGTEEPNGNSEYIDLSQCASILNRRFYRQGLEWAVAGFTIHTSQATTGNVVIYKLPDTWMCDNAYTKAYSAWKRQQDETIDEAGAESAVARWRDFKVFMNVDQVTKYVAAGDLNLSNLLPLQIDPATMVGEWQPSEIVVPNALLDATGSRVDPEEYLLHMVGINNNTSVSRGVIEGYADSRAYPQSPDPVEPNLGSSANWMREMFDVGNDNVEIIENVTDQNDDLPYNQVNYPGGETILPENQIHAKGIMSGTTIGGMTHLPGSNFKAGLIQIHHDLPVASPGSGHLIQVHLVPGTHRGYLAERLT